MPPLGPESTEDEKAKAFALLEALTQMTAERSVSPARFGALVAQWAPEDLDQQIQFLTEVKSILRTLPVQVFCDPDSRMSILQAAQTALDALIDREEEAWSALDPRPRRLGIS
jgi:type III secretion protein W